MAEYSKFATHHEILKAWVAKDPHRLLLKIPDPADDLVWTDITVQQHDHHIDLVGNHVLKQLTSRGISSGSIVSLWISGFDYLDVLYVMGLSRAGFIPHVCGPTLASPDLVYELISRVGSLAILHNARMTPLLQKCPVPAFVTDPLNTIDSETKLDYLPGIHRNPEDLAYIFHTSGSISGSPKPVKYDYQRLHTHTLKWVTSGIYDPTKTGGKQEILAAHASCAHTAGMSTLLHTVRSGRCQLLLRPRPVITPAEIQDMIANCGVNTFSKFAPMLAGLLRHAQDDTTFAAALKGLDKIYYGGAGLPQNLVAWAFDNGLKLMNILGSTEIGIVLTSRIDKPSNLLTAPGKFDRKFVPSEVDLDDDPSTTNIRLYELVIPQTSADCAPPEFADDNGDLHTGDVFEEAEAGFYIWRGRTDDWIKSTDTKKTDTRTIEDDVSSKCSDLVKACVVVGNLRPSPALIVEPTDAMKDPNSWPELKVEIVKRLSPLMERRYLHERINNPKLIHIVDQGSLPRTAAKGNIRRRVAEKEYETVLDSMYEQST